MVAALGSFRIIRAFRVRNEQSLAQAGAYVERCRTLGRTPDAYLFDTFDPGTPGGTGQTFRWELLRRPDRPEPLVLAGGLTPENVARAVREVRPWGVDVSGGVEESPGVKDPDKIRAFVEAVRGRAALTKPKGVDGEV